MRWLPAISGAVATASAALVLVSVAPPDSAATPAPVAAAEVTVTTSTTSGTTVEVSDPIDLTVSGLDAEVSLVLAGEGYTDWVPSADLADQLDPAVAEALADANTVLVIPSVGGG